MKTSKSKKNVKIIAMAIVAFFTLGIVGIAVTQTQSGFAAPASANSAIGHIDRQRIMQSHPDTQKMVATLQEEAAAAQKEFEEKAKGLAPQEQERYAIQLQQRLQQKEQDLMQPIIDKIEAEIKKVAQAKGLTVVVDSNIVVYGGTDITEDVIKSFAGGK